MNSYHIQEISKYIHPDFYHFVTNRLSLDQQLIENKKKRKLPLTIYDPAKFDLSLLTNTNSFYKQLYKETIIEHERHQSNKRRTRTRTHKVSLYKPNYNNS